MVVGAGGAGLSAAVAAAETDSRLKIVVLEKQGILGGKFAQAVSRYNAWQKAGHDDDFGRSATGMPGALETAPFYAVRVKPAIHHTMGGLSVNTETQVLRADGTPIGGLYAAGEVTGGLHGANRLGGNGVADIVVNGRLAGLAASKRLARSDHP